MEKNNAQEEIIHTVNGQLLVVACPGSGKTTTLLRRIHYMINEAKIPAQQILMVTFFFGSSKGNENPVSEEIWNGCGHFFDDSFYVYVYLKEIRRIYERIHPF